ncbi:XAP5-domain-containing protein [Mollisia scopiformis]|uniref:XAP5-domain-containing protein n=1 Tax=Mollisia scopiformis TaxID=149040 RepID=A0A194X7W5_MOLSC|nr:XAP5-domain-containing protein [Mollisia scopiformis]KUJ16255.1 XAP5-domain-containing protein [Mollisia scopiformis]
MASNPPSGTSTPNPRFTSQRKTAEDILSTQTVGLVNLSDFRKRRAEVIEQKERDAHESFLGPSSEKGTPRDGTPNGALTPNDASQPPLKKKKKAAKAAANKLSFGNEDEDEESGTNTGFSTPKSSSLSRSSTPVEGGGNKKKMSSNASVGYMPKALTKGALLREAQTRETLRKEFLVIQEQVKSSDVAIPFVFYDGTNIPGGVVRVKKGDYIWVFLDRSRKVGAELGVGEKSNSRREWARVGVDDLMLVRGSLIIPHHYDFYYFIINHTLGPNNRVLFDYSSEPTASTSTPMPESTNLDNYNPLSNPSKNKSTKEPVVEKMDLEGMNDDPTFTKVVDRRWYERNKHIFPASVWQDFDPEKDYQKEIKRDAGGNPFFFS